MLLLRKLARELRAQKGQTLAVAAVTALGVLLFVSSAGAYLDLQGSYALAQKRLALADLHADVTGLEPGALDRVRALPGVRVAESRLVTSAPVELGGGRVELRLLSLPDGGQPALDRLLVTRGRLPDGPNEVLIEKHLAEHHHLGPGSTLRVAAAGAARTLTVSGVGVSAEYLWVSRDEHDLMPSPDSFGVGWMRRSALGPGASQLLVACAPGTRAKVAAALAGAIAPERLLDVVPSEMLPGVRLLQMDVDGYRGMAAFFPILFLGVGAFIVAAILGRLVDAQRALIGTLSALGVGRARLLAHYLGYALLLGGPGALLGAAGGLALAPALTHEYAVELGIPFVSATVRWPLALDGLAIGLAVALLAGALPALHASRLHPAEAMRPPRPSSGPLQRAARRLRLPLPLGMALRDLLGRPLRSLGTALGVAAALVLVLTTGAMLDSMRATFSALFHDARRYDLRVDFAAPEPIEKVRARLSAIAGVKAVEGVLALPVSLEAGGRRASDVLAEGLAPEARLLRVVDLRGRPVAPASGQIVITHALGKELHVGVGDRVTVRVDLLAGQSAPFVVGGFADAAFGKAASLRRDDLARAFGLFGQITSAVLSVAPEALASARHAIAALPDAAHVENLASLREQMATMMGLGWVMLGMMLAFSVVLAAAILFNTATLGILERRREIATLRALGRTLREIALGLTLEHALVCVFGLALGLPLSVWAIHKVLALYSSDLFRLPFVLSPATLFTAALGILLVLLFAQWPALRQVARESLADAVRTREG